MEIEMLKRKFGMLTVLELGEPTIQKQRRWICECECGNKSLVRGSMLRSGATKSCGCLRVSNGKLNKKHGMSSSKIYGIWCSMIQRCENYNESQAENYVMNGIKVCDRWRESFENFYADMGERPKGMSLDRIDVNGPYSPENCRWADSIQQARNKKTTIFLDFNGERKPLIEWAKIIGLSRVALHERIFYRGWTVEEALTAPAHSTKKNRPLAPEQRNKNMARRAVAKGLKYGTLIKPEACSYPGCKSNKLQAHHHKGYDEEFWTDVQWVCAKHHPREHEILITAFGKTQTITQWSKELNLPKHTISARLKRTDWTKEEALSLPLLTYKNERAVLAAQSEEYNYEDNGV